MNWDATTETPGLTLPPVPDGGVDAPHIATCELDCAAPVTPSNVTSGGVTDFSDWSITTGKWGNTQGLYGAIYGYGGPTSGSSISASVDATNKDLHGVGMVAQRRLRRHRAQLLRLLDGDGVHPGVVHRRRVRGPAATCRCRSRRSIRRPTGQNPDGWVRRGQLLQLPRLADGGAAVVRADDGDGPR